MNILQVISTLNSGGAERFTVDLSNQLARNNKVTVVVLERIDPGWFLLKELHSDIKVISLNKTEGFSLKASAELFNIIKNNNIEIVHTHLTGIHYVIVAAMLQRRKITFVHTVHNTAKAEARSRKGILIRKMLFSCKFVYPVTISDDSHESFVQFYKTGARLICNGRNRPEIKGDEDAATDIRKARVTENTRILLNVASIQASKNQLLLAKCVQRLVGEGYDVSLLIIGRKVYPEIVEEIGKLDCSRIFILGEKSNPVEYMALADAFCLSSLYEGMPISVIEAFSAGLIPVCTPAGGVADMIRDGYNGILSTGFTEDDYYRALKQFIDMEACTLEEMKNNAEKSYEVYSMEVCAGSYQKLYDELKR